MARRSRQMMVNGLLVFVLLLATFPAVPTGAGITFIVTKTDANGEQVQYVDYAASPHHTTAYAKLTINTPGKYFARHFGDAGNRPSLSAMRIFHDGGNLPTLSHHVG